MKNILFIFLLLLISGCTFNEQPEFIGVDNIMVVSADFNEIRLKADALFNNGNDLGGTLATEGIKVFADDIYVGIISSEEFKVPPKNTFVVPMTITFSSSKLIQDKNTIEAILKQVLNKKVMVHLKGNLNYKVIGFSSVYPIDHSEEIIIK